MQQVYVARGAMEAQFVRGLLEQAGVEAVVEGEDLPEPTGTAMPTVWVRDVDVAQAGPIIEEYRQREASRPDAGAADDVIRPAWTCPTCGEQIEAQFTSCWKCGTVHPGTDEPDGDPPLTKSTPPPLPPTA